MSGATCSTMNLIQADDFLPPASAEAIERFFLAHQFPWFYYANVNYGTPPPPEHRAAFHGDERFRDADGFASLIFPTPDAASAAFAHAKLVLEAFVNKHGIVPTRLLRIKANLLVRSAEPAPLPFTPHVDVPQPHWAMIYYVNDSDGDTVFLDKQHPDWQGAAFAGRVSPKRGQAVLFDGRHYHCGTRPSHHDVRVVLNFNFV